jgi:hypothetical protein
MSMMGVYINLYISVLVEDYTKGVQSMLKKLTLITPVAFALASILSLVVITQPTSAIVVDDHKTTICHRTNSAVNPYNSIEVDDNSVDGVAGNSGQQPDHFGEHQGPVASSFEVATQLKKDKIEWGDIIPPVGDHGGLNWTEEGIAIYENDCNYEGEELVADITYGVVCSEDGAVVTLTNEGSAEGEVTVNEEVIAVPAGSTVERTIETGENGLQITITIDEDVVYDELVDCEEGEVLGETTVLPTTSGEAALLVTGAIASFTLIAGLISLAVRNLLTRQ